MKIRTKIVLSFILSAIVLGSVAGVLIVYFSRSTALQVVKENETLLAQKDMDRIDSIIHGRVSQVQVYALDVSREDYLKESRGQIILPKDTSYESALELDKAWSLGKEDAVNFAISIRDNDLSEELRSEFQLSEYRKTREGYAVYPEVFVTNDLGYNIAQTNITSDYYQADEDWWINARDEHTYIEDIEFDESAGFSSISISVRLEEDGVFLGVIKVIYNVEEIRSAVLNAIQNERTVQEDLLLFDSSGDLIFSSKGDISEASLTKLFNLIEEDLANGYHGNIILEREGLPYPEVFNFAVSDGYRGFDGFGWVLAIGDNIDEVFKPVNLVTRLVSIVVLLVIISSLIVSYYVSRSIAKPIEELTKKVSKIKAGNFDQEIDIKAKGEVGELASGFKKMISDLKESWASIDLEVKRQTKEIEEQKNALEWDKAIDEAILKSVGDGLIVVDKDSKILFANKASSELFGLEGSLEGKTFSEVVVQESENGEEVKFVSYMLANVLRGKDVEVGTKEHIYFRKMDGTRFPASVVASPVILGGEIIGAVEVIRDITNEVEVDKAKTEFVSLASHQLRTPLTAIKLFAEMLLKGNAGKLTDKQEEYMNDISFSTERMISLVNDLLNVSRLESGRVMIEPEEVEIGSFVEDIAKEMEVVNKDKKVEVEFVNEVDEGQKVNIDRLLARQVIHNILTNAVRYSRPNSRVILKLAEKQSEFVVSVKDTGIGIPDNARSRIFDKFYRADNAQKVATEGSGVGMYMSKIIVDAYGGRIWFESEENKGTTFYVTIPKEGMKSRKGDKKLKFNA